jgi:hypothetical protein
MSSSVNFADLMAASTRVSGIRRKMLMNFSFFAGSTVNHLECMVNNIPKDMGCGDVKVLRSLQCCDLD